jgi:hypothetical protein
VGCICRYSSASAARRTVIGRPCQRSRSAASRRVFVELVLLSNFSARVVCRCHATVLQSHDPHAGNVCGNVTAAGLQLYGTTTRNHYISGPPSRGPLAHPVRTGALGGAGGDVVVTVGVRLAVLGSVGIKMWKCYRAGPTVLPHTDPTSRTYPRGGRSHTQRAPAP